jgi:hypothetical protein
MCILGRRAGRTRHSIAEDSLTVIRSRSGTAFPATPSPIDPPSLGAQTRGALQFLIPNDAIRAVSPVCMISGRSRGQPGEPYKRASQTTDPRTAEVASLLSCAIAFVPPERGYGMGSEGRTTISRTLGVCDGSRATVSHDRRKRWGS